MSASAAEGRSLEALEVRHCHGLSTKSVCLPPRCFCLRVVLKYMMFSQERAGRCHYEQPLLAEPAQVTGEPVASIYGVAADPIFHSMKT